MSRNRSWGRHSCSRRGTAGLITSGGTGHQGSLCAMALARLEDSMRGTKVNYSNATDVSAGARYPRTTTGFLPRNSRWKADRSFAGVPPTAE